jgi:hypothetical protein
MRKYKIDMIMKIKLRIEKYSQVFIRVSTGYSGLKNVILVDQNVCFLNNLDGSVVANRGTPALFRRQEQLPLAFISRKIILR